MLINQSLQIGSEWFNQQLRDGGPVYTETHAGQFIVEPWNALSSLFIILPAIYWLFQIGSEYRNYKFLIFCIPLMILGGSGSTLFHAFRTSRFFLILDILPTAILTLAIAIYFWIKVFNKWWHILFIIIPSIILRYWIFTSDYFHEFMAINLAYITTGTLIGLPLLILLVKTKFYKVAEVIAAIILFIGAIMFREMDSRPINFLPMGTHFLWHTLTGFGAYFILSYLYHFRKRELEKSGI